MKERVLTEESIRAVEPCPRNRLLRAIPFSMLVALLLACAGPGNDAAPAGPTRFLADVPLPAIAITERAASSRFAPKRWVGRGARDVCGKSWTIELRVAGNKVTGEFWLGAIKYDIIGFLDSYGRMDGIPGRKNKFYRNHIGPRQMEFNITFSGGEATGEHYFFYGRCLTPMRLTRSDK